MGIGVRLDSARSITESRIVRRRCVVMMIGVLGLLAPIRWAAAAPKIRVVGAKDDAIAITLDDGLELTRTFRLVADNADPAAPLVVTIDPFQDAAGKEVVVSPSQKSFDEVTIDKPAALAVKATFPRSGKYSTNLDLIVAQKRSTTRIDVDVTTPKLGVKAQNTLAVRGERGAPLTMSLSLREIAGREWTITPQLASGVIKDRDQDFQVELHLVDAPSTTTISPAGDSLLTRRVAGFDLAGQYTGTLRLEAAGATALDVPFVAIVKEPWFFAALWIGVGVVLSALLRYWFNTGKKRLEARRELARLDERLIALESGATSNEGRALLRALRAHNAELRNQVATSASPLDLSNVILRLWAKARIAEAWLEAERTAAQMPAGTANALRADLDKVATILRRQSADDTAIAEADAKVYGLDERKSWRAAVAADVQTAKTTVEQARARADQDTAERIVNDVDPLVKDAVGLLTRDALEELAASDGPLTKIVGALARALADGLRASLDKPAPPGMTAEAWEAHGRRIAKALDVVTTAPTSDGAVEAYNLALRDHILAMSTSLEAEARRVATIATTAQRAETARKLETFAQELADAATKPAEKEGAATTTATLSSTYEKALKEWPRLQAAANGQDTLNAPVSAFTGLLASFPAIIAGFAERARAPGGAGAKGEPVESTLTKRLTWVDALATLALIGVAAASGLSLLWADDPIWGGARAHLVAFLWGLGLYQVGAGPAFEGLQSLRNRQA
jgi:hypothetical protein